MDAKAHVRRVKSASRLPTASSCFNTLYLPMYKSEADLRSNLHFALNEAEGFYGVQLRDGASPPFGAPKKIGKVLNERQ